MSNDVMNGRDSYDFVFRDSYFARVHEMDNYAMLEEFYKQVIVDPCNRWMFPNFSNLYVLVASYESEKLCKPGERTWKETLSSAQYDVLRSNRQMIIGYMDVDATDRRIEGIDYHGVNYIDTRVRGEGLAAYMLDAYLMEEGKRLIPLEIVKSAEKYWERYLDENVAYMYVRKPNGNWKLDL